VIALVISMLAVLAVIAIVAELVHRAHRRKPAKLKMRARARRQPELEEYMHAVLNGLRHGFGEIFVSYEVWKTDRETRMNLKAAPAWKRLSELTRSQLIRQVWRALELVTGGAVVVVDVPAQRWSREIDLQFDRSPLGLAAAGSGFTGAVTAPQYFKDG
jgi:hypothetical protein